MGRPDGTPAAERAGGARVVAATRAVLLVLLALAGGANAADAVGRAVGRIVEAGTHPWLARARFTDRQLDVWRVYEANGFQAVWLRDGRPTPQAHAAVAVLGDAAARGLAPADYDVERLRAETARLGRRPSADAAALWDAGLTIAVARYVGDASLGRVDPVRIGHAIESTPRAFDVPGRVALAASADPAAALATLDPPVPTFARLRDALAATLAIAARADVPEVPADLPVLRPGDRHAAVAALRGRLAALGDLPEGAAAPANAAFYDPDTVAAVRRFQERHGREGDGVVGALTRADLRVPLAWRAAQIALAMERLRWYAYDAGRYVVVNVPEFRLRAFDGHDPTPVVAMDVVVGSAVRGTWTPVVHGHLRRVVFRPWWEVPASIAAQEILPRAAREPGYLARERIVRAGGRLRQRPGPDNALGLVKFVFPNPYDVYLHDTPHRQLFRRSRRDFSHGCIRVGDAPALAEFVLGWDRERVLEAMRGPDDQTLELPEGIAVYVLYSTVVVEDGRTRFLDDLYGHDATLARALRER
jgi:murein L,D-transpeptidase YcbB/YkuD